MGSMKVGGGPDGFAPRGSELRIEERDRSRWRFARAPVNAGRAWISAARAALTAYIAVNAGRSAETVG
jgi:hypothetical protein